MGESFVQAEEAALERILKAPDTFQPVGDGVRVFRLRRFPYYLFYHYSKESEVITVYAVAHHKRQSDYWRSRMK
jgi:mRNA-degrading endonuclease RelE of RelBE toxin-antitoxin system